MKLKQFSLLIVSLWIYTGVSAHDFNTTETVRYVVECMADIGEQNDENLYTCACRLDNLGSKISYDQYADAKKFISYRRMPGEKGAIFRDSERGDEVIKAFEDADKYANTRCPEVKRLRIKQEPS